MNSNAVVLLLIFVGLLTMALILLKNAIQYFLARQRLKGVLAAVGGLGITGFLLTGIVLERPRLADEHYSRCLSNLHQFDLVLQAYCYPPVENYPTNLTALGTNDIAPRVFVCPGSKNLPGELTNVMEWTDYIYISGLSPAAPAEVPVFICPPTFHEGKGANMLMGDHSCTWCSDLEYVDELIENPLAFCSNAPASLRSNIYVHVSKRITEQSKGKYRSHGLK